MMKKKVVVAGGGVLGAQIGLISAYWGHDLTFWLRSEGSIGRTEPKIRLYSDLILKDLAQAKAFIGEPMGAYLYPHGLIRDWNGTTAQDIDQLLQEGRKNFEENIHIELDMEKALHGADIVIESISEDPKRKIELYQQMKDLLPEKTILVTNTSTLLPSMFAAYTGCPERYLALHFANTIWKHNTAEIMGHPGTDPEVYNKVVEFAREIGMVPICLHKEQPGYVLNSMLVPFLNSAQALWANDVADPKDIDMTWELSTGAPAGPFKILDIVGLETAYNINQMDPAAREEGSLAFKIGEHLKQKIDAGETGLNAGKGFYEYPGVHKGEGGAE